MTHSIDTEVRGQPGELRDSAEKLRGYVTPVVATLGDTLVAARRGAEDTWSSPAGEAFNTRMSDLIDPVDQLETYLGEAASGLDLLAGELEQSQRSMEAIRSDAAAAGLAVNGFVIEDPGPPLRDPGPVPTDADTHAAAAHADQTAAYNTQRARLDAYTAAASEAAEVRSKEAHAARSWSEIVAKKQKLRLAFTGADFAVTGGAAGAIEGRGHFHRQRAKRLIDQSRALGQVRAPLPRFDSRQELSQKRYDLHRRAYDHQQQYRAANKLGPKVALRGSSALAALGAGYDVVVLDRPWHEAAISGGASFGASVAAGALVGSMIPVPIVGTVAGAGVGAVAGIFASGSVDRMLEGGGPAAAFDAGIAAVGDAGSSTWNATTSAWNALF